MAEREAEGVECRGSSRWWWGGAGGLTQGVRRAVAGRASVPECWVDDGREEEAEEEEGGDESARGS